MPAKYKGIFADRTATSGELGMLGRRIENVEIIIVPLESASYPCHRIKYFPVPLLVDVDPKRSIEKLRKIAQKFSLSLSAFFSLAYDTLRDF